MGLNQIVFTRVPWNSRTLWK